MSTTNTSIDPYLQYRPLFAYSLPVQILLQGITFTLLTVLLIHLLFTTQYHYPLSRSNYALQISSILILLSAVVATLVLILTSDDVEGKEWPYMLEYVQVNVPPNEWSLTGKVFWNLLLALCNFLIHLGHIQFLTLLYPSALEVKLIYILLGPLSLCASGLTFTALSTNRTVIDLGDAIRNVFNSTLLLIFCISLILWGTVVNRKRAWRIDGGTCLFGIAATSLAVGSTMMNFVAVREDGLAWFQNLIWATVAWQSFSGYWWWVGSGMGIGEVEDILEREERKSVKEEAKKGRRKRRDASRARTLAMAVERREADALSRDGSGNGPRSPTSRSGDGQGSSSALGQFVDVWRNGAQNLTRRRASVSAADDIELQDIPGQTTTTTNTDPTRPNSRRRESTESSSAVQGGRHPSHARPHAQRSNSGTGQPHRSTGQGGTSSSSTVSGTPLESVSGILGYPINSVLRFIRFLRRNHEVATTEKVIERVARRNKAFAGETVGTATTIGIDEPGKGGTKGIPRSKLKVLAQGGTTGTGWGLGRRGVVEAEDGARRMEEAQRIARGGRLLADEDDPDGDGDGTDVSDVERGEASTSRIRTTAPSDRRTRFTEDPETDAAIVGMEREIREDPESEWVDEEPDAIQGRSSRKRSRNKGKAPAHVRLPEERRPPRPPPDEGNQRGWTWWGPLRKWRLADRSTF